jgi:hypothetical protein
MVGSVPGLKAGCASLLLGGNAKPTTYDPGDVSVGGIGSSVVSPNKDVAKWVLAEGERPARPTT